MIKCFILPIITISGTEHVAGEAWIHDALLLCTKFPYLRLLIQDCTQEEIDALTYVANCVTDPNPAHLALFLALETPLPPDQTTVRAQEILSNPLEAISQPDLWELVRIFGKRLGYRFDAE